jgi:hypothetical protein
MHALPVSMTPVSNFLLAPLTPVKLSKTVKVSQVARNYSPVSMTLAIHQNNGISLRIILKNQNSSGHVYWAQEEQF